MEKTEERSILLVEDEAIIAAAQKEELEEYSYKVSVASCGENALRQVLNGNTEYHLILMDIELGTGIDGIETAEKILAEIDIPVVFLSSHAEPEIIEKIDRVTSYGYVRKNSGMPVIHASIKMAFRLHNAHKTIGAEKQNWKKMFHAANQPIFLLDTAQNILEVNMAAQRAIDMEADSIIGKKCYELFHKSKEAPCDCPARRVLKNRSHHQEDMEVEALNGTYLVSCTPLFDKEGRIEKILHMCTDITQRKKLETRRMILEEAIGNSADAVGMSTPEGHHYYQNPSFDRLFGRIKSGDAGDLYVDKNIRAEVFESIRIGGRWEGEIKMYNARGEIIDVYLRAFANTDPAGNILSLVGIYSDITEQKQIQDEIAKQLNEKETLLREVHHRIKNNLSSIRGFLSLQADAVEQKEAKDAITEAIARVNSMYRIYQNLLITDSFQEISCRTYLKDLLESTASLFPQKGNLSIDIHIPDITLPVKQTFSIGMITNELVTNSFKYAFTQKTPCILSVVLKKTPDSFILTITDNGPGFTQSADTQGGFGLTLVQMLTEQLKGTLDIDSTGGVTACVTFPVQQE